MIDAKEIDAKKRYNIEIKLKPVNERKQHISFPYQTLRETEKLKVAFKH